MSGSIHKVTSSLDFDVFFSSYIRSDLTLYKNIGFVFGRWPKEAERRGVAVQVNLNGRARSSSMHSSSSVHSTSAYFIPCV